MKIILLNTSEKMGGAAIAANRLMEALHDRNLDVKMLVLNKQTKNPNVFSINTSWYKRFVNKIRFLWERVIILLCCKFNKSFLFKLSLANTGTDLSSHPLIMEADIVHLHWINQSFISLNDLEKLLSLKKPVIWTMHDMWPCTGICHHSRECENFQKVCGNCFYLRSEIKNDISNSVFLKKQKIFGRYSNLRFVSCSNWLKNRTIKSGLTNGKKVDVIPNPIDISIFNQKDKYLMRKLRNLAQDKFLLLFGALNVTDKQKGLDYLVECLQILKKNPRVYSSIELVVFGQIKNEIQELFDIPIHCLGYLDNVEQIVEIYNAVDVFVTPSLEENLPNMIMEAMACGTPCLGFDIGGIPEMIDHKINGYVARYKDAVDLANGIEWLEKNQLSSQLIRKKVLSLYSKEIVSDQYFKIYKELISYE